MGNSNYSSGETVELGDSITVSCDDGYWGGGTITCGENNAFDKLPFVVLTLYMSKMTFTVMLMETV